jgi:hypothetical protein
MSAPVLLTYKDLLDQSADYVGALNQALGQRDIRGCVQTAYDELAKAHKWVYLTKEYRIITVAPQNTGTVAYTQNGFQLVLSGATWPAWANQGSVNIGNIVNEIVSVANDGVTATLDPTLNPGQDVAALTPYSLYQDSYLMPPDFQLSSMPISENYVRFMQPIRTDEWLALRRVRQAQGQPTVYTFFQDARYYGSFAIGFYPAPDRVMTVDSIYKALPRPMKYSGVETTAQGTATIVAGTNTVTLSSGTLPDDMVGSVFRIRNDSTLPDGKLGLNQYSEQKIITAISGSTVTTDAPFRLGYTGGKFIVSDPCDISQNMVTAMIRGCELQLAIKRHLKDRQQAEFDYATALRTAMQADSRTNQQRSMYDAYPGISRRIARMPRGPDL